MKKAVTKAAPKKPRPEPRPRMDWQTEDFDRMLQLRTLLPYQFLLLCKLLGVTPEEVVCRFMQDVDCGSWEREGREGARARAIDYILECGYGQEHYSPEEIRQMFREMDSIGMLFPRNPDMAFLDQHAAWRDRYYEYWFAKWFDKLRRKL